MGAHWTRRTVSAAGIWILTALGWLVACGGDTVQRDIAGADGAVADATADTVAPPSRPDARGELPWGLDVTPPADTFTSDPACGEFDDGVYGAKVPWSGFTYDGVTYTCNACRGGDPVIQGQWRFHLQDDVSAPAPTEFGEILTIDGNVFRMTMRGYDRPSTNWVDAYAEGYYFCGKKPENAKETKVFVVTYMEPDGAFGWHRGDVFSAYTLVQGNPPSGMALEFYEGVNRTHVGYYFYCRIGADLEGERCHAPFSLP